jgi:hypothetical protein
MLYVGYLRHDPGGESLKTLPGIKRQHPQPNRALIEALTTAVEDRSSFGRP